MLLPLIPKFLTGLTPILLGGYLEIIVDSQILYFDGLNNWFYRELEFIFKLTVLYWNIYGCNLVHQVMNGLKQTSAIAHSPIQQKGDMTQLIDLFVDMCFDDINSKGRISQFKMLGSQLGFSEFETEKVVDMGKSEYAKMLDEINKAMVKSALV